MPIARGRKGVKQEMQKFHEGILHSGSKTGPIVTDPMRAVAISYRQAGMPKKASKKRKRTSRSIDRGVKAGTRYLV